LLQGCWFFVTVQIFENNGCNGNVRALEQRDFLLRWGRRLAAAVLLCALCYGGYRGYGRWRTQHLEKQVQQFVAAGEYHSAVLVARRLLDLNENNLVASRAMAEMAERAGRVEAVTWRKRIAHIEPNVAANQLAVVKAALAFEQPELAESMLRAVAERDRQSAEYHQLAGALALTRQDRAQAEVQFTAALALDPKNKHLALNIASIQLTSSDETIAARAREKITDLTQEEAVRVAALRSLAADALARDDRAAAREWTAQLHLDERATFSDELLHFRAREGSDEAAQALGTEPVIGDDLNPVVAREVRCGPDAGLAAELVEGLDVGPNRHAPAGVEILPEDGEDLAADLEHVVVAPLHDRGGVGQRRAILVKGGVLHGGASMPRPAGAARIARVLSARRRDRFALAQAGC